MQLDEPMGDSDGSVKGKAYFEVNGGSKYGIIVRPGDLKVGDYPAVNEFDEDVDVI